MAIHIQRRDFIKLLGGVAAPWPHAAHAQQQAAVPVVGFLHSASTSYFETSARPFRNGLKEAGYVESENVAIEYRWAEGDYDRLPALAADLVNRQVAVIFAGGGPASKAAKAATSKIPIVFHSAADPIRTGLVASLSRPGGNITGISVLASALDAKKLGLLRELVPQTSMIGFLVNPNYAEAKRQSAEFQAAASHLDVASIVLFAATEADINTAFATMMQQHAGALVVATDPFFAIQRDRLVALAVRYSIPVMYFQKEFVAAGGLISYGPNYADGYRQAGVYVGRVLKGEKPAELPVMQPTSFEFVINLKTAKTLGLTIPPGILAIADAVVE